LILNSSPLEGEARWGVSASSDAQEKPLTNLNRTVVAKGVKRT